MSYELRLREELEDRFALDMLLRIRFALLKFSRFIYNSKMVFFCAFYRKVLGASSHPVKLCANFPRTLLFHSVWAVRRIILHTVRVTDRSRQLLAVVQLVIQVLEHPVKIWTP